MIAYWIAFGPHGPRALPPPGEGRKIFSYTMIGVGISFIIFMLIRTQARGPPSTMTKEYQEMTNEYLKVTMPFHPEVQTKSTDYPRSYVFQMNTNILLLRRTKTPNPSPVSPLIITKGKEWFRVPLPNQNKTVQTVDVFTVL